MNNIAQETVQQLFQKKYKEEIINITALAESGSYRQYFRIKGEKNTVLGVYNSDINENNTYLSFSKTFEQSHINVPEIIVIAPDHQSYLVQDLGDNTLYSISNKEKNKDGTLSAVALNLYKKSVFELINIQTKTIKNLDTRLCIPRDAFDYQSIIWDLNYFKYFFLKLVRISFDEQKLEDEMQSFAQNLDKTDRNYFLFRDFQSRNIMIKDETPYFIDFQGGRKGALYYDLASLLYDANVELQATDRNTLSQVYYNKISEIIDINITDFTSQYHHFAAIRLMQALGAFGLRGIVENKPHFKECIPYAIKSLQEITTEKTFHLKYPYLSLIIKSLSQSLHIQKILNDK